MLDTMARLVRDEVVGTRVEPMALEPDDTRSPYLQITDHLRRAIALGEIEPGGRLPSNAELRQRYDVANQTVQNAINALKADGLVYGVPGRGVFVRSDLDPDEVLADVAARDGDSPAYRAILERLKSIGDSIDVINARLGELERHQGLPDGGAGPGGRAG